MHCTFASLETWDCLEQVSRYNGNLYGNGVPVVPNVHVVMAWATRKNLVGNEAKTMRNGETLTHRGKGDRVPTPKSNDSGDNECRSIYRSL